VCLSIKRSHEVYIHYSSAFYCSSSLFQNVAMMVSASTDIWHSENADAMFPVPTNTQHHHVVDSKIGLGESNGLNYYVVKYRKNNNESHKVYH
jgi:hypothetical protein